MRFFVYMPDQDQIVTVPTIEDFQFLLAANASLTRRYLAGGSGAGVTHNGSRDLWELFGFPAAIEDDDLVSLYLRGIGGRIIDLYAEDTWKRPPRIYDGDSRDTPFVKKFEELAIEHGLWQKFMMADALAQTGRYAVIYFTIRGESDPSKPLTMKTSAEIAKINVFREAEAQIGTWEQNSANERFMLPTTYNIQANMGHEGGQIFSFKAHWTRCIHVVINPIGSDVYGMPTLARAYNDILNYVKATGSSAEAFFRMARGIMALEMQSNAKLENDALTDLIAQLDEFHHKWRSVLQLRGIEAKDLTVAPPNPLGMFQSAGMAVSAATGIPYRKLFGSLEGNVGSKEVEKTWAGVIASRQGNRAEPQLMRPFLKWAERVGVLPKPNGAVEIGDEAVNGRRSWPSILESEELEGAQAREAHANALVKATEANERGVPMSDPELRRFGGLPDAVDGTPRTPMQPQAGAGTAVTPTPDIRETTRRPSPAVQPGG